MTKDLFGKTITEKPHRKRLSHEERILKYLFSKGKYGASFDSVCFALGLSTAVARVLLNSLLQSGKVKLRTEDTYISVEDRFENW